jgi:hypothetical protein
VQNPKYPYKKVGMLKKRLLENPKLVFLPLVLGYAYVLILTIFFKGWTWSLYDELSWVHYSHFKPLWTYISEDYVRDGRFRPLAPIFVYLKLFLFGLSPQFLRVERILEVIATTTLVLLFLRNHAPKSKWIALIVGIGFWLKSAPQLDQARWMFTPELNGLFFFACALLVRKHSKPVSYLFLLLMVTAKEPFAMFLPLPALLEKRWKEVLLSGAAGFFYMLFLVLNRRGYSTMYGSVQYPGASQEILKQTLKDFSYLILLCVLFSKTRLKYLQSNPWALWPSLVFATFGITYATLVYPMLWGYTYMLAPALFLIGIALSFLLIALDKAKPFSPKALVLLFALSAIFSLKISYNWTKNYLHTKELHALFKGLSQLPQTGPVGSNCPVDNRNVGFGADILVKSIGKARSNGPSCYKPGESAAECCKGAELLAIGKECNSFEDLTQEAEKLGLQLAYSNKGWKVYKCR